MLRPRYAFTLLRLLLREMALMRFLSGWLRKKISLKDSTKCSQLEDSRRMAELHEVDVINRATPRYFREFCIHLRQTKSQMFARMTRMYREHTQ